MEIVLSVSRQNQGLKMGRTKANRREDVEEGFRSAHNALKQNFPPGCSPPIPYYKMDHYIWRVMLRYMLRLFEEPNTNTFQTFTYPIIREDGQANCHSTCREAWRSSAGF